MTDQLRQFFKICYARLESGDKQYKDRYRKVELLDQIIEELADVANYAFLEYVKITALKRKLQTSGV